MSMDEKNEWVINYINTLVKGINEQYGDIIKEDQRNKAIFMYKDSDKTIDQIKAELDELVKELIKNYLKGQQKVQEKEKHYNLNDFFDCRISNNTLHIHVVPKNIKDDISRLGLGEYYKYVDEKLSDALSKIPAILKEPSNKNIRSVFAVSKLLRTSNAKKIFSKYGFDTSGVPDKIFEEMFHTDRIGQAIISREKFMSIYDKNNLNDELDTQIVKNGRIDASKTEYVQGLLLDKKQKNIDIKQIEQVSVALKSRKQEINKLKKQKLELTKEQLHNTIQKKKEKSKVLSLNNNSTNGFIDIIFGSIITIIIGLIMFILIK